MKRRWIPAIVFWGLFILSMVLYERYPWLDTVWYAALMLFLVFLAGCSVVQIFRHRHGTATIWGVPRWLDRFLLDKDGDRPNTEEKKTSE
jgi:hypothetical protein